MSVAWGAVNLGQCDKLVTVVCHQFITLTVNICVQHGGPEALYRTGLSVAAETCCLYVTHMCLVMFIAWRFGCRISETQCIWNIVNDIGASDIVPISYPRQR